MIEFFKVLLREEFLRNALFGALLACVACGVVGPFVVVRRIGYIAGGISHTVLGGMGIALFLGGS
ncbi:MAG: metal ABC transporter permease, partial [Deltaproteobacteria bacterium]